MISVMTFKTLAYLAMTQGLFMVQDLKLGHYMKIPPRAMFTVQMYATILSTIVNVVESFWIYENLGDKLESGLDGWTGAAYNNFFYAGAIWGAVGPARFFGPDSPYFKTLLSFAVGLVAPVIPWFLHKMFPNGYWHLVNVPLLVVFPVPSSTLRSDLITPLIIAIVFNYFVKKYKREWWNKYAYVLSTGFDCGAVLAITVIFFGLVMHGVRMPFWWLNRVDLDGCSPDWYETVSRKVAFFIGSSKPANGG
jgi:OPT family oligopeptide transporter